MTRAEKFTNMYSLLRDIADMSADVSSKEFKTRYEFVEQLREVWSIGQTVPLIGVGFDEPRESSHTLLRVCQNKVEKDLNHTRR